MRILKLILALIILALVSSIGYGQGVTNFGATRPQDTGVTKGLLKFTAYANSNTSLFLTVNAQGKVVFAVPAGGGGSADSAVFVTIFRDDTGKIAIRQAKQNNVALTTTGTSGASTFNPVTGALNIPVYANTTYSAGGWLALSGTTFYFDTANKKSTSLVNADNYHFITPLAVLNADNSLYSSIVTYVGDTLTDYLKLSGGTMSGLINMDDNDITNVGNLNKIVFAAPANQAFFTIADMATLTVTANATVSGINTGDQDLSGYMHFTDTAGLSARINLRLNSSDTAALSNRINLKLNSSDTASLSNRINLKLSAADTAALSNRINLKLNASDTAGLSNRINLKLNATDTAGLSNRINLKLNSADTAGLSNRINLRILYSDTGTLIPTFYDVDTAKQRLTAVLALKAPLASPALTGSPTAPTQSAGDNSTKIATTAYVATAVAAVTFTQTLSTTTATTLTIAGTTGVTQIISTITAQSGNLVIANPTGTFTEGEKLFMVNAATGSTTPTYTFGTNFLPSSGSALPTVFTASSTDRMLFIFTNISNGSTSYGKWILHAATTTTP